MAGLFLHKTKRVKHTWIIMIHSPLKTEDSYIHIGCCEVAVHSACAKLQRERGQCSQHVGEKETHGAPSHIWLSVELDS